MGVLGLAPMDDIGLMAEPGADLTVPPPDAPLDGDVIVRQSTIESMNLCPARVGLSVLPGFDPTPSEAMVRGTLVHKIIEEFLVSVRDGASPSVWPLRLSHHAEIVYKLHDISNEEGREFVLGEVASAEKVATIADEAAAAGRSWFEDVWLGRLEQLADFHVEEKVTRPLGRLTDGRWVWLQGTPDLIVKGEGFDWKTAGRGWSTNRDGLSKGDYSAQAPLYLWLAEPLTGVLGRKFTFWVYNWQSCEWEVYRSHWSQPQISAALLNAFERARQIAYGVFPYTPHQTVFGKTERGWWCSPTYCGGWSVCDGKRMLADAVNTEEKRNARW